MSIFVKSIFIDNMIFAYFLGMCSYLAVSKTVKTSTGLGIAVIFVLGSPGVIVLVWLFAPESEALMRTGVVAYLVLVCFWVWLVRRTRMREHPEETVRIDTHVCRHCGHAWKSEPT